MSTLMMNHSLLKILEKNHNAIELSDKNTTSDQVHLEFDPRLHQKRPSTKKTSLKLSPYGK